jgi:anti-sigma regulatory factor (Ser/Thr protein kinase)
MQTPCERKFARSAASVATARTFVTETLTEWHMGRRLDDVRLCVSELASNAVEHGVPAGRHFLVRVAHDDERVCVEVHDSGDGTPTVRRMTLADDRGRGLFLVNSVADEWGVASRRGPGKIVWAEFKLSAALHKSI